MEKSSEDIVRKLCLSFNSLLVLKTGFRLNRLDSYIDSGSGLYVFNATSSSFDQCCLFGFSSQK